MAEARAHARAMGVDVDAVHIRHDDDIAGGVLAMAAEDHAVLCCATHARGRLGEWLFQSVSAELIRRSTAPLVVVGPEAVVDPRPTFTEIVAAVDHSPSTPRVASTAASWSHLLGAKVRLLDVVEDQREIPGAWEPTKRLATTLAGLGYDTMPEVLVADDPAEAIMHTADHLGGPLLVVGTHGHPEVQHPALGRVSLAVVRHSPHPVVVVPGSGLSGRVLSGVRRRAALGGPRQAWGTGTKDPGAGPDEPWNVEGDERTLRCCEPSWWLSTTATRPRTRSSTARCSLARQGLDCSC